MAVEGAEARRGVLPYADARSLTAYGYRDDGVTARQGDGVTG
ncbi:hypothetical protein ACIRQY_18675 [Streptomyces sp. NPDC101490]